MSADTLVTDVAGTSAVAIFLGDTQIMVSILSMYVNNLHFILVQNKTSSLLNPIAYQSDMVKPEVSKY